MEAVGIDGMVIDDDDISKQTNSEAKKISNDSSHLAEEASTSKRTFSEIDSAVYENQIVEEDIESVKQTPDHHHEDMSKKQEKFENGDD